MRKTSPGRYARQEILPQIGVDGQRKLASATAFIVGGGGLGGYQAELLARAGLGRLRMADRDLVEWHNLHRQVLFQESDAEANVSKAEAAARRLREINSTIEVEVLAVDVTARNALALLADADIVLDATDNFETRYLINDVCVKLAKPWVYAGVVGTVGMVMPVLPGSGGPCLRCVIPVPPEPGTMATCDTAGVLNSAVAVIASLSATLAVRILLGAPPAEIGLLHADIWNMSFNLMKVKRDERCPCCALQTFEFLDSRELFGSSALCGRNSVQVTPARSARLDFEALRNRLKRAGNVSSGGLVIHFKAEEGEMAIFPDGRAIVADTTDSAWAKAFYARYIGGI
ncbi:MAG: ThiF family adenylyltransferase [Syntrophobacteraceae bacterium]|nr:ThiF family adenylyltransferase [Syntrophobacteraceae bacterium]